MFISGDHRADNEGSTTAALVLNSTTRGLSKATLRTVLIEAGLRPSRQRLDLGAMIFGWGDHHFTAEMLLKQASCAKAKLSLATIYNTLRQFTQAGLLREIAIFGSTTWYDTKTGPHCHLFIEETGELIDVPDGFASSQASLPIPEGFDLAGVDIIARLRIKPTSLEPLLSNAHY